MHLRNLKPRGSPACSRLNCPACTWYSPRWASAADRPGRAQPARIPAMSTLILIRHGESDWNAKGLFTGWVDAALSDRGRTEAEHAGRLLAEAGLRPDVLHTSVLSRAIETANIGLGVA